MAPGFHTGHTTNNVIYAIPVGSEYSFVDYSILMKKLRKSVRK
jgi:hypothetical protein